MSSLSPAAPSGALTVTDLPAAIEKLRDPTVTFRFRVFFAAAVRPAIFPCEPRCSIVVSVALPLHVATRQVRVMSTSVPFSFVAPTVSRGSS